MCIADLPRQLHHADPGLMMEGIDHGEPSGLEIDPLLLVDLASIFAELITEALKAGGNGKEPRAVDDIHWSMVKW